MQAGAQVIDSCQRHGNGKLSALPWLQQSGIWVTTHHLTDKARRKDASASGSAPTGHIVHVGDRGAADFLPVAMAYRSYWYMSQYIPCMPLHTQSSCSCSPLHVCEDSGDHVGDTHQYLGCASFGMDAVAEIVTVLRQHEEAVLGQSRD